jgi:hypothetical protein
MGLRLQSVATEGRHDPAQGAPRELLAGNLGRGGHPGSTRAAPGALCEERDGLNQHEQSEDGRSEEPLQAT